MKLKAIILFSILLISCTGNNKTNSKEVDISNKIDKSEYDIKNNELYRNKKDSSVYILTSSSDDEEYLRRLKTIDFNSARQLGSFWVDIGNVYGNYTSSDGDMLYKIEGADVHTFKPFGNTYYGRDKNHVYSTRHGKMEYADVNTFRPIILGGENNSLPLGKDKNNYFTWDEIAEDTLELKEQLGIQ